MIEKKGIRIHNSGWGVGGGGKHGKQSEERTVQDSESGVR